MATPAAEDIDGILGCIQANLCGVSGVFLSGVDGRCMGGRVSGVERVQLSAISAASMAMGKKAADDLQLGDLQQIVINGGRGSIVLLRVGNRAVLTLVLSGTATVDSVLHEARRAVTQLELVV